MGAELCDLSINSDRPIKTEKPIMLLELLDL